MTWNEFKKAVDEELLKKNISPDIEVFYIDVSGFFRGIEEEAGMIAIY